MPQSIVLQLKRHKELCALLVLASFFLFFRISHVDMLVDDAPYSARAIGMADYMFADEEYQPTPLQWFDHLPRWARLSFHDHPIVVLSIQHFFLSIHDSIFFAKLPYALMALGTMTVMYAWALRQHGKAVAVFTALLLMLNARFIYFGRTAFMESGVLFFLAIAWYAWWRFLADRKYWWWCGLAFGLLLEVKFTTLWMLAAALTYLLVCRRQLFRDWRLYGAIGLAAAMALPQAVYNVMMYARTGHFALQLSRLLHQPSPWHLSGASWDIHTVWPAFVSVAHASSWLYVMLFFAAIAYVTIAKKDYWFVIAAVWLGLEDVLIGSKDLWPIIMAPVLALGAVEAYRAWGRTFVSKRTLWILGGTIAAYFLFFVINSHTVIVPLAPVDGVTVASPRSQNFGMYQLDQYLDHLAQTDSRLTPLDPAGYLKIRDPRLHQYILPGTEADAARRVADARIILFDPDINWFSRVWLFERRRFYYNQPFISVNERSLIDQLTLKSYYFIRVTEHGPLDAFQYSSGEGTEQNLLAMDVVPTNIYRDDGKVAFKVYYIEQK